MSLDDEDLFDPPARPKQSSNKIVYQPPGAQWSLDRLPEVESLYRSSFNKQLPLVNRGQGSIHNKWGYDHRNSADVSINPSTPEGQQFAEQLKKANIPFLAFTSAIPGVATGPHIHIGFPSQRTQQKFNVGAQKKSTTVASDDLFDSPQSSQAQQAPQSDDDLFDSPEQSTPRTSAERESIPPRATAAPALTDSLVLPRGQRNRGPAYRPTFGGRAPTAEDMLADLGNKTTAATEWMKDQQPSGGAGELHRLDDPEAQRITRLQQEVAAKDPAAQLFPIDAAQRAAQLASREREDELKAQANEPQLRELTDAYRKQIQQAKGLGIGPEQWLNEAAAKGASGLAELVAGAFRGASPALAATSRLLGDTNRADIIALHAQALQRAAEEEGADRNRVSKVIQNVIGGTVASAPELAAMSAGAPPMAAFGLGSATRSLGRGDRPVDVARAGAHGVATGAAFELPLPQIANPLTRVATRAGTTGLATGALERQQGAPVGQAIETGLTNALMSGVGEASRIRNEPSALERGLARETPRQPVGPDAEIAARLRGEQRGTQAEVQSPVEALQSARDATPETQPEIFPAREPETASQKFYHRDYGEVTESPNQKQVGKGRVRVVDENGREHVIKRAAMTGRGNERAVPIREPAQEPTVTSPTELSTQPSATESQLPPAKEVADVTQEAALAPESQRPTSSQAPEGVRPVPAQWEVPREPLSAKLVTEPATETAVKNASMEADRAARDLPELAQAEPRKATEVHQRAIDANARDPRSVDRLVQQALESDKNLTDVETAQLRLRAQEIKNREQELLREIDSTTDSQTIREKRIELDSLTNEFDRLSQATKKAGTEWGRAGVARQQAIDQDFSLVSMKARLKAAKGGQLTEAENRQVEDLYRRNVELESKLAEAQDALAQKRLQAEVDVLSRRQRRTQTRQSLDEEFAQLKQQFAQARAEARNVQASGLAGLDPEGKLTRLIGKMARNRIQAGVTDAAQLVDDIHAIIVEHLPGVSKRDVRDAISGYSIGPKSQRGELQKQIDALRSQLKGLSKQEDITAGRRASTQEGPQQVFRRDQARQRAIQKQITDLEAQMKAGEFRDKPQREPPRYTRETYRLQKQLEDVRLEYERMKYRATASPATRLGHEAVKVVNALKTLKSIGDVSAMLRQGGFYGISHPVEGLLKPTREMIRSFTDMGYRNVEAAIKNDPAYDTLKQAGVEFTGVERSNPHLSVREEGFFGKEYLQYIPGVKQVVNFSERTFVSFLDAQRLLIGKQMIEGLPEAQRGNPKELQAIAKLINAGTGRGNLGKRGNQAAPLLNLAIFSPRLLVSRIQLLNNMISPRKLVTMPEGARARMIKDNVKFVGATMAALGLAKAAGMSVNLNPNDADFLKIRAGNTTYDTLTGLQQPLRYLINMGRAIEADITGNETYNGRSKADLSGRFARSKLSPAAGIGLDYILGKDYIGKPFSVKNEAKEAVMPLPAKDVVEAFQNEGLWGAVKATPTFTGIGVSNYPYKPYVNKKVQRLGLESDVRQGRKSAYELNKMVERGEITGAQKKQILADAKVSERQARFNNFPAATALDRFERMDPAQREEVREQMEKKAYNLTHSDTLTDQQKAAFQERLDRLGITPREPKKSSGSFKDLFKQSASPF